MALPQVINRIMSGSLVLQIAIGIVAGIVVSLLWPEAGSASMLLGDLFVKALKAVAPVLVLVLVASAIANRRTSHTSQLRPIVIMYLVGTIAAALRDVATAPGEVILPGEWSKAVAAIKDGKDINYEGASGPVDFDDKGDVAGFYSVNTVTADGTYKMDYLR